MAKGPAVNIYQGREGVSGMPASPHVTPEMTGAGYGRAVGALGADLAAAGQEHLRVQEREQKILQEAEDKRATVEAHKLTATAELDAINTSMGLEEASAANPYNHGERVSQAFDKYTGKMLEGVTNPRAREFAEVQMAQLKTRQMVRALQFEKHQIKANNSADVDNIAEDVSNAAHADEFAYASGIEKVRSVMELTGQGHDTARFDKLEGAIAYKTALGYAKRNPAATMNLADMRGGLKPTERAPAYLNASQRAEWQQAAPEARRAMEYKTQPVPDYLSEGQKEEWQKAPAAGRRALEAAAQAVRGGDSLGRANAGDYVQPPDTEVSATGTPGKTGVPFFDKLTPEQAVHIRNIAEAEYKVDVGAMQARVRGQVADSEVAADAGKVRPGPSLADAVGAYGKEKGEEIYRQSQLTMMRGARRGTLATQSAASLVAMTTDRPMPPEGAPPGDYANEMKSQAEDARLADSLLTERNKDWMAAAPAQGIASTKQITWRGEDAEATVAELRNRDAIALSADKYAPKASKSALSAGEAAGFRANWHRFDPMQAAGILQTMKETLSPIVYRDTIQAIAPDSAATRTAAAIMLNDGRTWAVGGAKPRNVAAQIIRGERMLNPDKYQGKEDGKPTRFAMPQDFEKVYAEKIGPALAGNENAYMEGKQAVAAFLAAEAADLGQYTRATVDPELVEKSIGAVIGQVTRWRGIGTYVAPWGMEKSDAEQRINAAWDAAMAANGYGGQHPFNQPERTTLEADAGTQGVYRIRAGSGYVIGKDGAAVKLDIRQPTLPRGLAAQVPK